jgi:hypothetical protein
MTRFMVGSAICGYLAVSTGSPTMLNRSLAHSPTHQTPNHEVRLRLRGAPDAQNNKQANRDRSAGQISMAHCKPLGDRGFRTEWASQ